MDSPQGVGCCHLPVWQHHAEIERKAQIKFVTSVERLAVERGREKWMAEGETKGKLETLTRLLTRRFGPLPEWVAERLASASVEQLEAWFDSGVDAATLAEVLGGH